MDKISDITQVRIKSLEKLVERGQIWDQMAKKYGVTNPVPPWKSSLDGICDALDNDARAVLPTVIRRQEEDRLSENQYSNLPFPERQLVSLAYSLITRGIIDEKELIRYMTKVRARLESCT